MLFETPDSIFNLKYLTSILKSSADSKYFQIRILPDVILSVKNGYYDDLVKCWKSYIKESKNG